MILVLSFTETNIIFAMPNPPTSSENPPIIHPIKATIPKKLSKALSGEKNPMYGNTGDKNPFYNKRHSAESKRKMSESHKGSKSSNETKTKISQSLKGNTHRLGTIASDETKKKMSESMTGKTHTTESKKLMSEKRKLFWERKRLSKELPDI